jgi:hypothetical protein
VRCPVLGVLAKGLGFCVFLGCRIWMMPLQMAWGREGPGAALAGVCCAAQGPGFRARGFGV